MRLFLRSLLLFLAIQFAQAQTSPHGQLNRPCSDCHTTDSWRMRPDASFNHTATGFPLADQHAKVECRACHADLRFSGAPTSCQSCHTDIHRGELGTSCLRCHDQRSWRVADMRQRHQQTRFALVGIHAAAPCDACHQPSRGQQYAGTPVTCVGCHRTDYTSTAAPPHVSSGFSTDCMKCHSASSPSWGGRFEHDRTAFPLTGAHRAVDCLSCHRQNRFAGTPTACRQCHETDFVAAAAPNHAAAGFPRACEACHSTSGWQPSTYDHTTTGFSLTGAHRAVACTQCHANNVYAGTGSACVSCHSAAFAATSAPNHTAAGFQQACQLCHTTSGWQPASYDHAVTGFTLTGAHRSVACNQCHTNNVFAGTGSTCISCHAAAYAGTTSPNHTASGFPQTCENCHTTSAWLPSSFDHDATRFPLAGAHRAVVCTQCHVNNTYAGTALECVACHQTDYAATTNPPHASLSFPTTCLTCHNMNGWPGASFDHAATRFPLTGAHATQACIACHNNNNYTLVYQDCYGCHQADFAVSTRLNHPTNQLSHSCESCHSTSAWMPSTFAHDTQWFKILYSGKHLGRWSTCMDCHQTPGIYTTFNCLNCHEHSNKAETDGHHSGVSGYVFASPNCYQCHRSV